MAKTTPTSDTFLAFVTDDASEEVIKNLPLKDSGINLMLFKGTATSAHDYLRDNHSPRILLVDISESVFPISDIAALAEVCEPGVEVIAVGVNNDIGVFRGLLNLGVKDYIVKPLTANLLMKSLGNIATKEQKNEKSHGFSRLGSIITFIGAHGGVGTSMLAANCGWVLAELCSKHIYLLDLNLHSGMLCHFFNIAPMIGLKDILTHPERLEKHLIDKSFEKYNERISIASAQESLSEKYKIEPEHISKLFNLLCNQSHYTIIDLPRNFESSHTLFVLGESDFVMIVVDFTLFSVRDTAKLLVCLKEINRKNQRIIIIANRVGEYKRGEIEKSVFEEAIQRPVDYTIRFDAVNPLEAINTGSPVAQGNHLLARDIQKLSQIFASKEVATEEGFLTKIMGSFTTKK